MIGFDGFDQAIKDVGHGMGYATPVGNHGDTKRVLEKPLGSEFHAFQEHFDGRAFLVPVEREAIDGRVVFVSADRFLSGLQICGTQGLEDTVRQHDAFAREIPEERFRNVDTHLEEAGIGIVG
jgi:hypothetical protein